MPANAGKTPTPEGRSDLSLPERPLLYMFKSSVDRPALVIFYQVLLDVATSQGLGSPILSHSV